MKCLFCSQVFVLLSTFLLILFFLFLAALAGFILAWIKNHPYGSGLGLSLIGIVLLVNLLVQMRVIREMLAKKAHLEGPDPEKQVPNIRLQIFLWILGFPILYEIFPELFMLLK